MARQTQLTPEFIELAPRKLMEGVLYVSMLHGSVIHKCCCGCGEKVVTPLGPTDWKLTYDGEAISLHPSVGNWSLRCQSHYWIQNNQVHWAARIVAGRNRCASGERACRKGAVLRRAPKGLHYPYAATIGPTRVFLVERSPVVTSRLEHVPAGLNRRDSLGGVNKRFYRHWFAFGEPERCREGQHRNW